MYPHDYAFKENPMLGQVLWFTLFAFREGKSLTRFMEQWGDLSPEKFEITVRRAIELAQLRGYLEPLHFESGHYLLTPLGARAYFDLGLCIQDEDEIIEWRYKEPRSLAEFVTLVRGNVFAEPVTNHDPSYRTLMLWVDRACACLVRTTYSALPDVKEAAQQLVEEIGYEGSRKMSKSDGEE